MIIKHGKFIKTIPPAYNMAAWNGTVCVAGRAMMISGLAA
ncbi:hypothetical protein ADIS_0269 [Lunatimonas lonarensis]|uniref:Uncharacterized protein n=1 Tax=Lunatimonas lonarensis TaxID=1232681 RepID=R7ZYY1_9BACT|nr:hypothetical protein ADIS_0269 [Lunatimonas lonarensis]